MYLIVKIRDATIPFFPNRFDPIPHNLRIGRYRSIPIPAQWFFIYFFCNLEFGYFSVLTRSSLFCVLNTIYYSVSQLVGQKFWVCSPKVGCQTVLIGSRIIYSQRNDINKKTLNAFLMRDFYFKRRA